MAAHAPEECLRSLQPAVEGLQKVLPHARWTRPELWHLTLRFYGEVPEAELAALIESIRSAAASFAPIESSLGVLGAFPSDRRARVLWVGLADSRSQLGKLASALGTEERFTPHLTLARFKTPEPVGEALAAQPADWDRSPFTIDRVRLVHSVLGGGGPRYTTLSEFPLSTGLSTKTTVV